MKKYLNEEQYQKMRKKLIVIASIILIAGLIVSIILLNVGITKNSNSADTTHYDTQISTLNQEISVLNGQISDEFRANGLSARYYELSNQRDTKQSQIAELEIDKFSAEYSIVPFLLFGGAALVLVGSCATSIRLYIIAFRRNIAAFKVQQAMPLAKEGLEEIAPTIGKVTEEISKGISKGKSENEK